jgi:hypothetical protein
LAHRAGDELVRPDEFVVKLGWDMHVAAPTYTIDTLYHDQPFPLLLDPVVLGKQDMVDLFPELANLVL